MPSQQKSLTSGADTTRTWDGSPQTKYEWFESLQHTLISKDISFCTLWQSGYVVDRTKVLVFNDMHAKHLSIGNVKKKPFNDPTLVFSFHVDDASKDVSAVPVDNSRYVIAPEMLEAKDRSLFAAIADTIDNPKRREDYEKRTSGSGLKLISVLVDEINEASVEISQWAARRLADIVAAGLSSPTTVAFDLFRKNYEEANAQLPKSRRNVESVVADTYVSVVRQLGDNLGTRIDMELMLARMAKGGKGSALTLDETVRCILSILSDQELRHPGHALRSASDKRAPPLVWTEGKHEICSVCKGAHGGGRHLRRDCPDKPSDPIKKPRPLKPPASDAANKGAAKRAAASDASEDDVNSLPWEEDTPVSALFNDHLYPSLDDTNESTNAPPGCAFVLASRPGERTPSPSPSQPAIASTPTSREEAQRLVEKLSPISPMKTFAEVEKTISTGVSLRTGGSDRRSRLDILGEMRGAVGLSPLVVPVGLPVGSVAAPPACPSPSSVKTAHDSGPTMPSELPQTPPSGAPPTDVGGTSQLAVSNPLQLVWELGALRLTHFCIQTSERGKLVHTYTFDSKDRRTWAHDAAGIKSVCTPPVNSVYLGRSASQLAPCWGTSDGAIVIQRDTTPSSDSSDEPTDVPKKRVHHTRTPPAATTRRNSDSLSPPTRHIAVAMISLVGALAAVALGASAPGASEKTFDPGEQAHLDPHVSLAVLACLVVGLVTALQANAGGGRRARSRCHASPRSHAPATSAPKWVPQFQADYCEARTQLCESPTRWRYPWLIGFVLAQFALIWVFHVGARRLHLRLSARGHNPELLLLTTPHRRIDWNLAKKFGALAGATALHAAAFSIEPAVAIICAASAWSLECTWAKHLHDAPHTELPPHFRDVCHEHPSSTCCPSVVAASATPTVRGYAMRSGGRPSRGRQTESRPARGWRWVDLVIDSGCTWHVHNRLDELTNIRPCHDVVEDAAGNQAVCSRKGDLPLVIRSEHGVELSFTLRDVRWAPDFPDSLISVDQLWETSRADCVFRDKKYVEFTLNQTNRGEPLRSPFSKRNGLYRWTVAVGDGHPCRAGHATQASGLGSIRSLKTGIHAAGSTSHLAALPADILASVLHRRLHVGLHHLRRLSDLASDAPAHIESATQVSCTHCTAANAARLPHSHSNYQPSHAGRLLHIDIAGPFKPSRGNGYRYCLLVVDDHSRFKFIYFLHKRSDAASRVKRLVAEFNALVNENSNMPIQAVGKIRSDNAGEFVSREFSDLADDLGFHHVTSPPHISQLNGVAERAIRSTFSLVRSYLGASSVPVEFWPHAAEMAVEVLNRTSGPSSPHDGQTSYELMTGQRPRILGIMPFGCRAFAVKPRDQYSKTTIEPRAWIGVNLGRSARSPGGYKIWCPSIDRVVVTSDAYFMEHLFPCRPKGFQIDDEVAAVPTRPPAYVDERNSDVTQPSPTEGSGPSDGRALSAGHPDSHHRALLLFSGSYTRPDGLAAMLRRRGFEVECVDNDPQKGQTDDDILADSFFIQLLERAKRREFDCIFAAPPCSTYSVARFFKPKGGREGAPVVRSRDHVLGLPKLPPGHDKEVRLANEVTRRTCAILTAAGLAGSEIAVENPADRGDPTVPHLFQFAEHAPIWIDPHMIALRRTLRLSAVTFAQCMVGGPSQKYTTFWYSAGMCSLDHLKGMICKHAPGTHAKSAGGEYDESEQTWNSAQAAAYPADLNAIIAEALVDSVTSAKFFDAPTADATANDAPTAPKSLPAVPTYTSPNPPVIDRAEALPSPLPSTETPVSGVSANSNDAEPPASDHSPTGEASTSTTPKRKYERRTIPERALGRVHFRPRNPNVNYTKVANISDSDPTNHAEAMKLDAPGWGEAETKEISNHESNGSWEYMLRSDLPEGRRIVKLTWVYKTKRGESKKKKARLCVQGCSQVHGEDYDQTFCAAMRAGSLRTLCAISARLSLHMFRWDFVAAYLQGSLEPGEVVYCAPPAGFATAVKEDGKVHMVPREQGDGVPRLCKVVRPVYGMAQAGRRWQRTLFPWLLAWKNGGASLQQSELDTCIFHCRQTVQTAEGEREELLIIGCYVDDLFILASHTDDESIYHRFTTDLSHRWDVEDEGPVSDLLSIEIQQVPNGVALKQTQYIDKLLASYAPEGKPISKLASLKLSSQPAARTPCGPELPQLVADALTQPSDSIDKDLLKSYQSLVGALLYCAVNTRPDVAYSVGMLCRAMGKPTTQLLDAAYRVLYYLHHHKQVGLHYAACELDLSGMSDADWATQYSTSGYVFMYSQAAISWSSKKQACVALSSCEAEIVALSEAAKEGVYLSRFLEDLGFPSNDTVGLATDNSAARDLSYNPEHHERTKHIERRHFFIRDMVENHRLVVPYVSTTANLADFFTKPLAAADFYRHRNAIMNLPSRSESTIARAGGC